MTERDEKKGKEGKNKKKKNGRKVPGRAATAAVLCRAISSTAGYRVLCALRVSKWGGGAAGPDRTRPGHHSFSPPVSRANGGRRWELPARSLGWWVGWLAGWLAAAIADCLAARLLPCHLRAILDDESRPRCGALRAGHRPVPRSPRDSHSAGLSALRPPRSARRCWTSAIGICRSGGGVARSIRSPSIWRRVGGYSSHCRARRETVGGTYAAPGSRRLGVAPRPDRPRAVHTLAMISIGRTRVMNKQKKKTRPAAHPLPLRESGVWGCSAAPSHPSVLCVRASTHGTQSSTQKASKTCSSPKTWCGSRIGWYVPSFLVLPRCAVIRQPYGVCVCVCTRQRRRVLGSYATYTACLAVETGLRSTSACGTKRMDGRYSSSVAADFFSLREQNSPNAKQQSHANRCLFFFLPGAAAGQITMAAACAIHM